MVQVASLWRHPIKAHGREALDSVALLAGKTMPGDRVWAVAHEAAKTDGTAWASCANFSRGAKAPQLMAITARFDQNHQTVTLNHPDRPELTFAPDDDASAFIEWVRPLMPKDRAASTHIVKAPDRGMTDSDFPSISLIGTASLNQLSDALGKQLSPDRFRANIWMDDLPAWQEFDWVGKTVAIGGVQMKIVEPIERCMATTVNPATGERDADTLGALKDNWGHKNLGVFAQVIQGGKIALGDEVRVL